MTDSIVAPFLTILLVLSFTFCFSGGKPFFLSTCSSSIQVITVWLLSSQPLSVFGFYSLFSQVNLLPSMEWHRRRVKLLPETESSRDSVDLITVDESSSWKEKLKHWVQALHRRENWMCLSSSFRRTRTERYLAKQEKKEPEVGRRLRREEKVREAAKGQRGQLFIF